ncbi:MAG: hypothetical protein PHR77_16645 [Kiritimatiellae bacterium]|nr:hypothetical protein [Kiritimatiellia bacterium]MDD5521604.1 hypothetical protein [Kiritimatiellia bacterium]
MKRIITSIVSITAVHWILTVGISLLAWQRQEGGTAVTTSQALLNSTAIPLSYALNFPVPFLLHDNSLLIMACNSTLFAVTIVLLWIGVHKLRNVQTFKESANKGMNGTR